MGIFIYICKELSISIGFSRFSVCSHISKTPATIAYPCKSPILFIRIPILLSDLLLPGYIEAYFEARLTQLVEH